MDLLRRYEIDVGGWVPVDDGSAGVPRHEPATPEPEWPLLPDDLPPNRRPPTWRIVFVLIVVIAAGAAAVEMVSGGLDPGIASSAADTAVESTTAAAVGPQPDPAVPPPRPAAARPDPSPYPAAIPSADTDEGEAEDEVILVAPKPPKVKVPKADLPRRPQRRAKVLNPEPANILRDLGGGRFTPCHATVLWTYSPPCVFGKKRKGFHVMVLGDSHMAHWGRPLEKVMDARNWRVTWLTKASCTPAITRVYNERVGRELPECDKWRQWALTRIAREKPDLVLVGGTIGVNPAIPGKWRPVNGWSHRRSLMVDAFEKTLKRLRRSADNVVVVADIPAPRRAGIDPIPCIQKNRKRLNRCSFSINSNRVQPSHVYMQFDKRAARRVKGIQVLNMIDHVCPNGRCRVVIDDRIVYRDDTHLSGVFTGSLSRVLNQSFPASWVGEGGKAPARAPAS